MKTKSSRKAGPSIDWASVQARQQARLAGIEAHVESICNRGILQPGQASKSGDIEFANAALIVEGYFSEPLTAFAMGWRDPNNIEATLEFFAPKVPCSRRFEYAETLNVEEFYSDVDDIRSIGSDFKDVEYKSIKTTAKTQNKGLSITIDLDEIDGAPGWEQRTVAKLQRRLLRNELRRAITLISAAATNTAKTWDTTALKDPDQDIRTDLLAAATLSGVRPNRVGFGDTAFDKRVISHRAQNTAGGYASAVLTPDNAQHTLNTQVNPGGSVVVGSLSAQLGVDRTWVSRERYQSAAATKTEIVNNLVLEFFASDGMDTEDASNIKRFVSNTDAGGMWRVFSQQISSKLYRITVEYYSLIKITSTLGLKKLTIS